MLGYHLKQIVRDLLLLLGNPWNLAHFSPQHQCIFDETPIDMLVHVGANTGQEMATYRFFKIPKVIWIEPDKRALRLLKIRRFFYFSKDKILSGLLDDAGGKEVNFFLMSQSGANSMFIPTKILDINSKMKVRGTRILVTKTAEEIFAENDVKVAGSNNCLVLDVQGAELRVLRGFENETLLKFRVIMFEWAPNLYEVPDDAGEIRLLLTNLGYEEIFSPLRPGWDDIIYSRKN